MDVTIPEKFVAAVVDFCRWVESGPEPGTADVKTALRLLATLYCHAFLLKPCDTDDTSDTEYVSDEEFKIVLNRFSHMPFDFYNMFYSPAKIEEQSPVTGSLADDLADIYRDVKPGLRLFEKGHMSEANWEWIFGFQIHWGKHATGAINALHVYMVDKGIAF